KEYLSNLHKRRQLLLFSAGIVFFLLSFSWANIVGNLTADYTITQYGLFGMPVFLGFLSYLILKYQAFNVKVIATQYFIVIIWLAVSSQFFLNQERSDYPLLILSWLITTFGGFWLFRVMGKEDEMAKQLLVAQAKLSRINNKLREISQAKSEFISIASHQLRTPLTSIKGYACLILEKTFGLVPKKQKEALEKILINNEKLVLLVEDMLNVSRLEAGRLEYDFEKQPILPIVEDAISNLKLYAKNKGLSMKLVKCRDAKNLNIIADSRKIFEIISNLIDNSIKYTPKGGLIIKIEKTKHSQKIGRSNKADTKVTDWIKISVADTGIGIDKKDLETIFEKYQQGESLIGNSTPASTGLGIYIGRQMAKAHGGKLYAKSEGKNKGSTFVLCLPLAQENGEK
ncbi:MAG: HAMP domain-containing sensor histidine kinase, partial [Candidatus Moranbacteria bacterium]|nr:HAMP domain-containing sensor histidine kinase [Candidatus Moranbacteria bacterium]